MISLEAASVPDQDNDILNLENHENHDFRSENFENAFFQKQFHYRLALSPRACARLKATRRAERVGIAAIDEGNNF